MKKILVLLLIYSCSQSKNSNDVVYLDNIETLVNHFKTEEISVSIEKSFFSNIKQKKFIIEIINSPLTDRIERNDYDSQANYVLNTISSNIYELDSSYSNILIIFHNENNSFEINFDLSEANSFIAEQKATEKNFKESEVFYKKAILIDSNNSKFFNNLASIFVTQEEYDTAIYYMNKAIEIEQTEVYLTSLGFIFFKKKDYTKAMQLQHKALKINPKYAKSYAEIGYIYEELNNYDSALVYFDKALKMKENHSKWERRKAILLSKKGELNGALSAIDSILYRDSNEWENFYIKGEILNKMNKKKEACELFDYAWKIDSIKSKIHIKNNFCNE